MNGEFHAQFGFLNYPEHVQTGAVNYLLGMAAAPPKEAFALAQVSDPLVRIDLLAQALLTPYKDYARAGSRREGGGLLQLYRSQAFQEALDARRQQMAALGLLPALPDISALPHGAWAIQFTFTLRTPYISKDDVGLHILDNPVRKDRVFGLPMVASTGWKGALRAAMMQPLASDLLSNKMDEKRFVQERLRLYRLFGNEADGAAEFLDRAWAQSRVGPRPEKQGEIAAWGEKFRKALDEVMKEFDGMLRGKGYRIGDIEGFQGCLFFYPTFFTRLGLEVINPHDRQSNAGKQPIYFECVPAGAQGDFTLLYVPFDLFGQDEAKIKQQALADLQRVAEGLQALFLTYGFSAKRTGGYGVAEDAIENLKVATRAQTPAPKSTRLRQLAQEVQHVSL